METFKEFSISPGEDLAQQTSAKYMQRTLIVRLGLCFVSFVIGSLAQHEQNIGLYFVFSVINGILGGAIFFFHCSANEKVSTYKRSPVGRPTNQLFHSYIRYRPSGITLDATRLIDHSILVRLNNLQGSLSSFSFASDSCLTVQAVEQNLRQESNGHGHGSPQQSSSRLTPICHRTLSSIVTTVF